MNGEIKPLEQELLDIQERNKLRAKEAIKNLGEKYLLHSKNKVQKLDVPEPILPPKKLFSW